MIARTWLAATVILFAQGPAGGAPQLRNIYVMTEAFCLPPQTSAPGVCHAQSLPVGATLEIQLPGGPSRWKLATVPPTLKPGATRKLQNPGRIEGTKELHLYRFTAVTAGEGTLVFAESPAHMSKPGGSFTFPITVTTGPSGMRSGK
jgi:hypothetical protein